MSTAFTTNDLLKEASDLIGDMCPLSTTFAVGGVADAMAPLSRLLAAHLPYSAQEKVDYALGVIDAFSRGKISHDIALEALQAITADEEMHCFCGHPLPH